MIYGSCIFIYAILPNAVHDRLGWMVVVLLALFAVVVTAYYTRTWDFDFFTTAYGLQVAVLTVTSIYHCKNPPGRTTADASADVKTKKGDSHTYDKGYKKWESFDVEAELERSGANLKPPPPPLRILLENDSYFFWCDDTYSAYNAWR